MEVDTGDYILWCAAPDGLTRPEKTVIATVMTDTAFQSLYETILSRKGADPESSYTAALYAKGTAKIAQKVGEEAVETCIEALQGNVEKLKEESADLIYHLMVLWADQGIRPEDVAAILQKRSGTSGHDEKNSRK